MFDIVLGTEGLNNNIKINELDNKEFLCNEYIVNKNTLINQKTNTTFHHGVKQNGLVQNNIQHFSTSGVEKKYGYKKYKYRKKVRH